MLKVRLLGGRYCGFEVEVPQLRRHINVWGEVYDRMEMCGDDAAELYLWQGVSKPLLLGADYDYDDGL